MINFVIFGLVRNQQHLGKLFQSFDTSDFSSELRKLNNVKVFVELEDLFEVLLLNLVASKTLFAGRVFLGINKLVDNNAMCVNVKRTEFLDHTFCFVERKEFRNTDTDKAK